LQADRRSGADMLGLTADDARSSPRSA